MYMTTPFVDKVKGFLMAPARAFQDRRADTLNEAFRYYFVLLVIFSILYAIVSAAIGMATFTAMLEQLAASGAIGEALAGVLQNFSGFVVAVSLFFVYILFLLMLFGVFLERGSCTTSSCSSSAERNVTYHPEDGHVRLDPLAPPRMDPPTYQPSALYGL